MQKESGVSNASRDQIHEGNIDRFSGWPTPFPLIFPSQLFFPFFPAAVDDASGFSDVSDTIAVVRGGAVLRGDLRGDGTDVVDRA